MAEHRVARVSGVPEGEARGFTVMGREIVLCRVEDEVYALQGICTHQELPLDGGEVEGGVLTCEWHGATFEVCSGRVLGPPATQGLRSYRTRIDPGGDIWVEVPD
jgi:3-phenylpropionate/trans-cinnamate dioxygenase ferredoxin subunit